MAQRFETDDHMLRRRMPAQRLIKPDVPDQT